MTVSLLKGQTISLEKAGHRISKLHVGLGWDPAQKKKGFFGFLSSGSDNIDLDASCLLFDASKGHVDTVWFRQLSSRCGSVIHTGDNLTGEGDGDDEVIKVDVSRLPKAISYLVFTVSSFRGQTFNEVDNAVCRVIDDVTNEIICSFTLSESGAHTGVIMGVLSRGDSGWSFRAIGKAVSGRSVNDMISDALSAI